MDLRDIEDRAEAGTATNADVVALLKLLTLERISLAAAAWPEADPAFAPDATADEVLARVMDLGRFALTVRECLRAIDGHAPLYSREQAIEYLRRAVKEVM